MAFNCPVCPARGLYFLSSFTIICKHYETGSIIMTSNKHFSEWGEMMSDTVIATATLDIYYIIHL